jgi:predicted transglutaminase-like cysteine proteinase
MRILQHIASMLLLMGLLCPAAQAADQTDPLADVIARGAAAKWRDVLARIDSEEETLAACRESLDACSPAARRLLQLVELGRQRAGRARLGEINRAVNLSIRATSDLSQYGVADFWSAPLATIEKGARDCEDYAVLAVHSDGEWLLLDNGNGEQPRSNTISAPDCIGLPRHYDICRRVSGVTGEPRSDPEHFRLPQGPAKHFGGTLMVRSSVGLFTTEENRT